MSRARLRGREFNIVRFTEDAEWVLQDEHGDVILVEESTVERVEVRCDFCGNWSTHAAPVTAGRWDSWMCYGGTGACDEPAATADR